MPSSRREPLDPMAALRRFRALVEQSADVIMLVGPTGELLYASLAASSVLGYAPGENLGRATFALVHPDDLAQLHALFRDLLTRSTEPTRAEFRVRHKDGSWRYLEATGINRLDEPAVEAIVVTCRDVTDRRQAEESLRATQSLLQSVLDNAPIVLLAVNKEGIQQAQQEAWSRKLIEAQEAERRAVARELHDDFGQVLTALKLNLQRRDRDDAETIALVDGAIARMRELAQDLRPPLLDEFGLAASLGWYVEREAKRAGLDFRLALAPLAGRPPIAVETTCFRIAQEALTNVVRHAQARLVEVELSEANGTLLLTVRDDGQGFDVAAARRRAAQGGSQGLLSMQERVTLADGDLHIDSTPSRGTAGRRVDVQVAVGEGDALLHAEQALAPSLRGAPARGGDVEALAVVAHRQQQRAVRLAELDLDDPSLRVTDDVRERLLRDAEARRFHRDRWAARERGEREAEVEPGALGFALHVPTQRCIQAELVEQRGAQVLGELAHPRDRAVDERDGLGVVAITPLEVQLQRGEHRSKVIVQLAGDGAALRFLRLDQLARQCLLLPRAARERVVEHRLEEALRCPQRFLRLAAVGDVAAGDDNRCDRRLVEPIDAGGFEIAPRALCVAHPEFRARRLCRSREKIPKQGVQ